MLVLLIIFMVTAPMMQQGIDVDLPETNTQPIRVQDEPLILTVQKDGKVYISRREIPQAELREKLAAIFEGRDSKELFLRADKEAPYGMVVKALAAAREAGATKLGMVTEPEEVKGGEERGSIRSADLPPCTRAAGVPPTPRGVGAGARGAGVLPGLLAGQRGRDAAGGDRGRAGGAARAGAGGAGGARGAARSRRPRRRRRPSRSRSCCRRRRRRRSPKRSPSRSPVPKPWRSRSRERPPSRRRSGSTPTCSRSCARRPGTRRPTPAPRPRQQTAAIGSPTGQPVSPEFLAWERRARASTSARTGSCLRAFGTQPLRTSIVVELDAAGAVVGEPRIVKRSGNPWYDEGVVRSIQKASPLPPPPEPGEWSFVFVADESL